MSGNNKSQLKTALLIVFLCFLLFFVLAFFYFNYYVKSEKEKPGAFTVDFLDKSSILIENKLPISDTLGKTHMGSGSEEGIQGYVEFTVHNRSNIEREFVILLDKQSLDTKVIKENYIKVYLTDDKDEAIDGFTSNPVPTFNTFYASSKILSSKVLYKGTLEKNSSKTYRVRVWLSDTYEIMDEKESFSMKVNIE